MLYTKTVKDETLELLKNIMSDVAFRDFCLAGGTALALIMGHRISVDLDLFTSVGFDSSKLEKYLQDNYGFKGSYMEEYTLKGEVDGVKLDFLRHDYKDVSSRFVEDGIRFYDIKDIATMKLLAIADNGTRLKDFVDIAYLSTKMSLDDMLEAFELKYSQTNSIRALKGLTYYEDIKFDEPIHLTEKSYSWDDIEDRLSKMIQDEDKVFVTMPEKEQRRKIQVDPPSRKKGRRM